MGLQWRYNANINIKLVPLNKVILGKLEIAQLMKNFIFMNLEISLPWSKELTFVPTIEAIPQSRILF